MSLRPDLKEISGSFALGLGGTTLLSSDGGFGTGFFDGSIGLVEGFGGTGFFSKLGLGISIVGLAFCLDAGSLGSCSLH
jgi:hypothetical protein